MASDSQKDSEPEECETTGMRLIYTLTRQIDGEIK